MNRYQAIIDRNLIDRKDLILCIETSSRSGSVAIADSLGVLAYRPFSGQMRHNTELFPTIRAMLKHIRATPGNISEVYIAYGPGSFTGIRMAVTMAKTMHFALGTRTVAVDTLDVIAANVPLEQVEGQLLMPIIDAKMHRFFVAGYTCGPGQATNQPVPGLVKVIADTTATAKDIKQMIESQQRPACLLGDGLLYYRDLFEGPGIQVLDPEYWAPTAINVYRLGRLKAAIGAYEDPIRLVPNYLLPPQVTVPSRIAPRGFEPLLPG